MGLGPSAEPATELTEERPDTQDLVSKQQKANLLSVLSLLYALLPGQPVPSQKLEMNQLSEPSTDIPTLFTRCTEPGLVHCALGPQDAVVIRVLFLEAPSCQASMS